MNAAFLRAIRLHGKLSESDGQPEPGSRHSRGTRPRNSDIEAATGSTSNRRSDNDDNSACFGGAAIAKCEYIDKFKRRQEKAKRQRHRGSASRSKKQEASRR